MTEADTPETIDARVEKRQDDDTSPVEEAFDEQLEAEADKVPWEDIKIAGFGRDGKRRVAVITPGMSDREMLDVLVENTEGLLENVENRDCQIASLNGIVECQRLRELAGTRRPAFGYIQMIGAFLVGYSLRVWIGQL